MALHAIFLILAICYLTIVPVQGCNNTNARHTLQTLHYNNLGPENNGTAYVLIHDLLSHQSAAVTCSALGESLLPITDLSPTGARELRYQLDGLNVADSYDDVMFWVKAAAAEICVSYSPSSDKIYEAPCDKSLPVLCTSTVAPTSDLNRIHAKSSEIVLYLGQQRITGYRDKRSFRFLGIPFADAPVGKLRFMAPRKYSGTNDIDATKLPPPCLQAESPYGDTTNMSEDCLYLNVFTSIIPAHHTTNITRQPVAVYFYGGSFVEGASSLIDYDGGNFASRNGVIIVTVNYRLGALGFLASKSMLDGSLGIRDQVQALEWVQDNIAAFGGDPDKVSIFGQSAGGQSVIALLSSSSAKGLFRSAIVQSAPMDLPWYTRDVYTEFITPLIAEAVGCNGSITETNLVACLQSVPGESFISSQPNITTAVKTIAGSVAEKYLHSSAFMSNEEPFLPIVDDRGSGIIDDQFDILVKNKKLPSTVPVLFTTVTNEGRLFISDVLTAPLGNNQSTLDSIIPIIVTTELGKKIIGCNAFRTNISDTDGVRNAVGDLVTYSEWICAQSYILDLDQAGSLFPSLYQIQIGSGHVQSNDASVAPTCKLNNVYNATCHTADVLPIWGTLNSKMKDVLPYFGNNDVLYSQYMNDVWAAFFQTSNPNPDANMLKRRGPAYAFTATLFSDKGYKLQSHVAGAAKIPLLAMPPAYVDNPGASEQCAVFTKYGYTFQHAGL